MRQVIAAIVNSQRFQYAILALIFFNSAVLAVEAMDWVTEDTAAVLRLIDRIVVWVFIVEIALRIIGNGRAFFRDGWSIYDFLVVAISAPGTVTGLAALRILRALRMMRVLSGVSHLRRVGEALVAAVPGISWVIVMLVLFTVVFGVIGTNLFGDEVPEYFEDLFTSMYTLFMVMTLEDWPDVSDAVLDVYPWAWIFFVVFIMVATFTILNLFVGVIVTVMDRETSAYHEWEKEYRAQMRADVDLLKAQVESLLAKVDRVAEPQEAETEEKGD